MRGPPVRKADALAVLNRRRDGAWRTPALPDVSRSQKCEGPDEPALVDIRFVPLGAAPLRAGSLEAGPDRGISYA